jgi:Zn-dependent protease
MKFTNKEINDLLIAWFMISLAFAILFSGPNFSFVFMVSFFISALTVGIGFLFHELMHKYFAQKYKLKAEFHAFYNMLFLALLFSFFGFIIVAPGAVFIQGRITKERNGKISLAGPMTNIILSFLFLVPILFFNFEGILGLFFNYGFSINSILALFNLIPVMPFDGRKIYVWNKGIYTISVLLAVGLFIGSFFIM